MSELSRTDRDLLDAARETLRAAPDPHRHRAACALLTDSGEVLTGLHLDATMSNAAVHAEGVALGRAAGHDATVRAVAAVSRPTPDAERFPPIAPCGTCRELLADYAPEARVVVPVGDGDPGTGSAPDLGVRTVGELLPDAAWHGTGDA